MHSVAIYVRASSTEQVASCPDQLKALRKAAQDKHYTVVAEYVDDGVSGSREIEKRIAFHKLVADSYQRSFTRILVWDTSRFGRLDSQAAGEYKVKLRRNGVTILESLSEGAIDWATQMGRLQDALMSEANHEYALKLSRSTIRGRISKLEQGIYPHGMIPYGYDKQYVGNGQTILIPREQKFRAPRGWTRTLVINEEEAAIVRLVYDLFVNRGKSILQIVKVLARRGTAPAWNGFPFSWDSVNRILRDKCYIGYAVMHKKKGRTEAHNRMPDAEIPGVVPCIIDDQLWHDAQKLQRRPGWGSNRSDKGDRVFTSLLFCGHCGYRLTARDRKGEVFYTCSSHIHTPHACPQWRATQAELLPVVIRELVQTVDGEILTQLNAPTVKEENSPADALTREVEKLRTQVKRAVLRAATADDDLMVEFQEAATELKKSLTAAEERLRLHRHVESEGGPAVWVSWWADVRPGLVLAADDPELAAEVEELQRRFPAMGKVTGAGGFDEFKSEAKKRLIRVAPDGDPDPLRTIIPAMLESEDSGQLLDFESLRGILRRLGCGVTLWWKPNPVRRLSRDPRWVLDRGQIKIDFRWQESAAHSAPTATCGGRS